MSGVGALTSLVGNLIRNIVKINPVKIDNWIFSLHYNFTAIMLLFFSGLVGCIQLWGEPMTCGGDKGVDLSLINVFCWVTGTFTVEKGLSKQVGTHVSHPGVHQALEGDRIIRHTYYQWIGFVLFLQFICFTIPNVLWKSWENHKIERIVMNLNKKIDVQKNFVTNRCILAKYLYETKGHNDFYAAKYIFCEVFNFVHVVAEVFVINRLLGNAFLSYGIEVLKFADETNLTRADPLDKVFPKVTKCYFYEYGSGGDVQKKDYYCLLPLNIVNEKIYMVLWFWLMILAILSGLMIFYRAFIIFSFRSRLLLLRELNPVLSRKSLECILNTCSYGDWFLLCLLRKNMNQMHYKFVIEAFVERIERSTDDQKTGNLSESSL